MATMSLAPYPRPGNTAHGIWSQTPCALGYDRVPGYDRFRASIWSSMQGAAHATDAVLQVAPGAPDALGVPGALGAPGERGAAVEVAFLDCWS